MGCTESVPVQAEFDYVHKVDPNIPTHAAAGPSPDKKVQLIVREKLFSWSGDSFQIKTRDGKLFGNGIQIKGKVFAFRDQMALLDGNKRPIFICLRKFELIGQTFKIYTPNPVYPGQVKSDRDYNGMALYSLAQVQRVPFSTVQEVYYETKKGSPTYTIHRAGGLWPKKRTVKKNGITAAFMEGGTWDGNWNSYLLTINAGIDPCLMICLAAICDEMDEE